MSKLSISFDLLKSKANPSLRRIVHLNMHGNHISHLRDSLSTLTNSNYRLASKSLTYFITLTYVNSPVLLGFAPVVPHHCTEETSQLHWVMTMIS